MWCEKRRNNIPVHAVNNYERHDNTNTKRSPPNRPRKLGRGVQVHLYSILTSALMRFVVKARSRPLYPREVLIPIAEEAGYGPRPVLMGVFMRKFTCPTGIRKANRPALSHSDVCKIMETSCHSALCFTVAFNRTVCCLSDHIMRTCVTGRESAAQEETSSFR